MEFANVLQTQFPHRLAFVKEMLETIVRNKFVLRETKGTITNTFLVSRNLVYLFLLGVRKLSTDPSSTPSLINVGNVGKDSSQHVCSSDKSDSTTNTF